MHLSRRSFLQLAGAIPMLTLLRRPQFFTNYHWSEINGLISPANVMEYVESPSIGQEYLGPDVPPPWILAVRTTYDGGDPSYVFDAQTGRVALGVDGGNNGYNVGGAGWYHAAGLFETSTTESLYMLVSRANGSNVQAYRNTSVLGAPVSATPTIGGSGIRWRSHYQITGLAQWTRDVPRAVIYNIEADDVTRERIGRSILNRAVFFGDSITFGLNASDAAHRWVNLVAESQGWTNFINAGISGSHMQNSLNKLGVPFADNGRDTYFDRVQVYFPNKVFIMYGMNDFRYTGSNFTVANFQNDYGEVVDALIASGVAADDMILGTIPYVPASTYTANSPDYNGGTLAIHLDYNAAIRTIATGRGTRFVDVYTAMLTNGGDALVDDGVHPNDEGHQVIADAFIEGLT